MASKPPFSFLRLLKRVSRWCIKPGMEGISFEEALAIVTSPTQDLNDLKTIFSKADSLRQLNKGSDIITCAIVNAKSGGCPEDCAFCSQSSFHSSLISRYPLISAEKIFENGLEAFKSGATEFSIVTSGKGLGSRAELENIKSSVTRLRKATSLACCGSFGILEKDVFIELKNAGLQIFHHNLETSRNFFPKICTTHKFEENTETVKRAKDAGLKVCCGGIFGMGEDWTDRIDLLFEIRSLGVDCIPINFLNPIKGTKLEKQKVLPVLEALKIIALARLINPSANIVICGGREITLGDHQSEIFLAGANGLLIGDYLTTKGRSASDDLEMILSLGLTPRRWIN